MKSWGLSISDLNVEGVQFHPESIVSEHGHALFRNFVETTNQGELT
jgi:anthranilate synthase component 2